MGQRKGIPLSLISRAGLGLLPWRVGRLPGGLPTHEALHINVLVMIARTCGPCLFCFAQSGELFSRRFRPKDAEMSGLAPGATWAISLPLHSRQIALGILENFKAVQSCRTMLTSELLIIIPAEL